MKDKEHDCPNCGNPMKYRGSRTFYCKNCKKTFIYERPYEPPREGRFF